MSNGALQPNQQPILLTTDINILGSTNIGRSLHSVIVRYFMSVSVQEIYLHICQTSMWTDITAEKTQVKKKHGYIEKVNAIITNVPNLYKPCKNR